MHFRPLTPDDKDRILDFARRVPADNLLFLRRDIRRPEEVDGWIQDVQHGRLKTTLAADDTDKILGYVVVDRGALAWRAHVAEIRVLVHPDARRIGLDYRLLQLGFEEAVRANVSKIVGRVTPEHHAARVMFEELGFHHESTLRQDVQDTAGRKHDLMIYSVDLEERDMTQCADCAQPAPVGLTLEGRQLCWSCYGLRSIEFGFGDEPSGNSARAGAGA